MAYYYVTQNCNARVERIYRVEADTEDDAKLFVRNDKAGSCILEAILNVWDEEVVRAELDELEINDEATVQTKT